MFWNLNIKISLNQKTSLVKIRSSTHLKISSRLGDNKKCSFHEMNFEAQHGFLFPKSTVITHTFFGQHFWTQIYTSNVTWSQRQNLLDNIIREHRNRKMFVKTKLRQQKNVSDDKINTLARVTYNMIKNKIMTRQRFLLFLKT